MATIEKRKMAIEMTPEEFRKAYNRVATDRNVPKLQISAFKYEKDGKTFGHEFIQGFYLLGQVNGTGKIKTLKVTKYLMLHGADRKAEFQAAAFVFLMVIQTFSPELNSKERAEIISKFADSSRKIVKVDSAKIEYEQAILEDSKGGKILMFTAEIKEKARDTKK